MFLRLQRPHLRDQFVSVFTQLSPAACLGRSGIGNVKGCEAHSQSVLDRSTDRYVRAPAHSVNVGRPVEAAFLRDLGKGRAWP
jgi:hypothetical protein